MPVSEKQLRAPLVLVANDQEWAARSLDSLLGPNGYAVVRAHTGRQTLDLARTTHPDAIVIDSRLPEMGGLELARRVTAEFPGLPILLISGYSDSQELGQVIPGELDLLQKPFSGTELTAAVARCLGRRASNRGG